MRSALASITVDFDRRSAERGEVRCSSTVRSTAGVSHDVVVHDLSASGLSFTSEQSFAVGTPVTVGLSGSGSVPGTIIRHERTLYGCAFDRPLTTAQLVDAFSSPGVLIGDFGGEARRPAPVADRKRAGARLLVVLAAAGLWAAIYALI
ncbi:PilZ domain-containing protein [Sphingomonas aracearum]|uniref:PilZ domain-containing protein n=1 Tax=Sphingomonas aracearum TaxID=2283317 RepID=A0A369VVB1_9SPHN|nr:PilZ domain-containing protein [Sphingomonas aracearum]RDE06324.1 PilZ domain-containing protein [Sphingomonas aracearum]